MMAMADWIVAINMMMGANMFHVEHNLTPALSLLRRGSGNVPRGTIRNIIYKYNK
jgi:hypothetical protein